MSEHGTRQRYQPEQVVNLLRQIEVAVANGKTTAQACKEGELRGAGVLPLG
jgi:putative transposase